MPSDDKLKKRILEMKYDIFPLNRMLPLSSVHKIFVDEYNKLSDKEVFMRERKYQRLREGYFGLFVGISLQNRGKLQYFMRFPESDDNDVDFLSLKDNSGVKTVFNRLICDVKEYTQYSGSFDQFVEKTIIPKATTSRYHIVVGLHNNVGAESLKLIEEISSKKSTIWLVSSPSPECEDYSKMIVTTFNNKGCVFQDDVDLLRGAPISDDPAIVFQNSLNERLI